MPADETPRKEAAGIVNTCRTCAASALEWMAEMTPATASAKESVGSHPRPWWRDAQLKRAKKGMVFLCI